MEKLFEKFNNKKLLENLVIFLILAIIVLIVINSLFDSNTKNSNSVVTVMASSDNIAQEKADLEKKLENILSKISGAGKVYVMVSYSNGVLSTPMTDVKTTTTIVSEKDSNGGERKTEETSTEENVIYEQEGNNKMPMIKQEVLPSVIGVIVVAEGANNVAVKEKLINAVTAAIDVPSHRIQVFAAERI